MTKLPGLRPREVAAALQKAGFRFVRQRGGHRIYVKGSLGITIPWHTRDLRKGTLRQIIRQSGMTVDEFLELIRS